MIIIIDMCKLYIYLMCFRLNLDPLKNPYVPKEKQDLIRKRMRIVVL